MGTPPVNGRVLPAALIIACLIPFGAGLFRMFEIMLHGSYALMLAPDQVDEISLFVHVFGALGFLLIGAFQLLPGFRHRHRRGHQKMGRVAAPMGLIGAVSGLWITVMHPAISSQLLYWGRMGASGFWILAICLGLLAIRRRNFAAHGAWMIRAYAIALPAGTLGLVLLPVVLTVGEEGNEALFDIIQVLAWPVHLIIAEWIIHRRESQFFKKGV